MTRLSPTEDLLADVRGHLAKLEGGMVPRTEGDDIADLHLAVTDLHQAVARLDATVRTLTAREVL